MDPNYMRGTETILLVEDEAPLRGVVSDLLAQLGYKVLTASDGTEALAVAANYSDDIHLLLTDVVMPEMAGPELAEKMASQRAGIKVIFVSGFAVDALAPDGVLKPDIVLVHKPFSLRLLAEKIRQVLGPAGLADAD